VITTATDKEWEDFWSDSMPTVTLSDYRQQLKDRLCDIIAEYVSDENLTPEMFYDDVVDELKSWVDYYEKGLMKSADLYCRMQGFVKPENIQCNPDALQCADHLTDE
jgi:predicted house-cleaning noncanonical NTP pyrophosphatase (MazG superfamily)